MTGLALTLVLSAAFIHASWNFLAKRAGGGAAFVWLFAFLSTIIYLPLILTLLLVQRPHLDAMDVLFIAGSAAFHLGYFLTLQRGYREGDLSLIYPLARGTGPTLSTTAAILLFNERPTVLALIGALLIITGVFILTGGPQLLGQSNVRRSLIFGLITGVLIAGYTLWDKYAVSTLRVPPLLLDYGSTLGRVGMLAPYARRHWSEVLAEWRSHRFEVIGVACLNPLSYILVLTALTFTAVSYVAPAREVSVLIAVILGTGWLKEGHALRRIAAAHLIILGVMGLALN
ncbi:MAG: EamA family transporter [Anaerolineales bacterium]|nr:EamA family transporter [Anaerolineales bacterium]